MVGFAKADSPPLGAAIDCYRQIFLDADRAIGVFSTEGAYQEGNLSAQTLWDLPSSPPPDFTREGPLVNQNALEAFRQACAGQSSLVDPFEFQSRIRGTLILRMSLRPLVLGQGEESKIVVTVDDITLAVEQTRLLRQALAEKEKADLIRRENDAFISKLAHEMRNPLNGIFGITELLSAHPDLVTADLLGKLHACSTMLSALIDDTLDLSRLEQNRLRLVESGFDLPELLSSVVGVHSTEAEVAEISLSVSIGPHLGYVRGDVLRIRQILVNLLTNAIKYTPAGGTVTVSGFFEDSKYVLRVADTGVGISQSDMKTLFEPFFQVDHVASGSKRGIGLGLSIVKNLVDLMQGSMGVESILGQGSTFWVELPLTSADPPPVIVETRSQLIGQVLVVEDNAINRGILKLQLELHGASVTLAQHGVDALLALEKRKFDVVLMDCHMPIMDGYEATRQIRACPEQYGSPTIIALTASATDDAKQQCLDVGMNEFLCKPISKQALIAMLSDCLLRIEVSRQKPRGESIWQQ